MHLTAILKYSVMLTFQGSIFQIIFVYFEHFAVLNMVPLFCENKVTKEIIFDNPSFLVSFFLLLPFSFPK